MALTIRSILRGDVTPASIHLTLSRDEFAGVDLPRSLLALQERGLKIVMVPGNTRSYKKLIPTLESLPARTLITADDDVYYPRSWLRDLLTAHLADANSIVGHRGTRITGCKRELAPYVEWPPATRNTPPNRTFLTGVGGILYPPESLSATVSDMDLAMNLCPTADDIWFKAMALLEQTPTRQVGPRPLDPPTRRGSQRVGLFRTNVGESQNDAQMRATLDYFDLWGLLDHV
ncbi:hypothetical protein [Nocardioides pinisoli]|uniref:Glycosyltransferase n=1 Tax=Nocardioides pinisoli TaxID=2950279 RepID=A0ABT1KT51_9ACTN|nr:hypothetical protein [Nocardioides pinisoli]MCP3420920.1 hypothetical protein [Nocardioides pinisoli]